MKRRLLAAHDAHDLTHGFSDADEAIPVAFRNILQRRLETVSVESLVTTVAQQQLSLIVVQMTELTTSSHDALFPSYALRQLIETETDLGDRLGGIGRISPPSQTSRFSFL